MTKIGILGVGSGSMGAGIAQVAATAGHEVLLYDNNPSALEVAKNKLLKILNRLVEKGRMDDHLQQKPFLEGYTLLMICRLLLKAGVVIEAIIEDLKIKKSVFKQLENITDPQCILATNTSSLSIAAIASACDLSERVIGIHFFNPAPLMKLVEIIPAIQTSPYIIEKSRNLIESWGIAGCHGQRHTRLYCK